MVIQRYSLQQKTVKHHDTGCNDYAWTIMVYTIPIQILQYFNPGYRWSIWTTGRNFRWIESAWPWTSSRWSYFWEVNFQRRGSSNLHLAYTLCYFIRPPMRMLKSSMRKIMKWNQLRKSYRPTKRYSRQSTWLRGLLFFKTMI